MDGRTKGNGPSGGKAGQGERWGGEEGRGALWEVMDLGRVVKRLNGPPLKQTIFAPSIRLEYSSAQQPEQHTRAQVRGGDFARCGSCAVASNRGSSGVSTQPATPLSPSHPSHIFPLPNYRPSVPLPFSPLSVMPGDILKKRKIVVLGSRSVGACPCDPSRSRPPAHRVEKHTQGNRHSLSSTLRTTLSSPTTLPSRARSLRTSPTRVSSTTVRSSTPLARSAFPLFLPRRPTRSDEARRTSTPSSTPSTPSASMASSLSTPSRLASPSTWSTSSTRRSPTSAA